MKRSIAIHHLSQIQQGITVSMVEVECSLCNEKSSSSIDIASSSSHSLSQSSALVSPYTSFSSQLDETRSRIKGLLIESDSKPCLKTRECKQPLTSPLLRRSSSNPGLKQDIRNEPLRSLTVVYSASTHSVQNPLKTFTDSGLASSLKFHKVTLIGLQSLPPAYLRP